MGLISHHKKWFSLAHQSYKKVLNPENFQNSIRGTAQRGRRGRRNATERKLTPRRGLRSVKRSKVFVPENTQISQPMKISCFAS